MEDKAARSTSLAQKSEDSMSEAKLVVLVSFEGGDEATLRTANKRFSRASYSVRQRIYQSAHLQQSWLCT